MKIELSKEEYKAFEGYKMIHKARDAIDELFEEMDETSVHPSETPLKGEILLNLAEIQINIGDLWLKRLYNLIDIFSKEWSVTQDEDFIYIEKKDGIVVILHKDDNEILEEENYDFSDWEKSDDIWHAFFEILRNKHKVVLEGNTTDNVDMSDNQ